MSLKSWLSVLIFFALCWIKIPYELINLNKQMALPIYTNTFFKIMAVIFFIIFLVVVASCKNIFKKIGKGTPVPFEPPKEFVVQGLYQYVRNPMYISYLFSYLGIYFWHGSLLLLAYVLLWFLLWHLEIIYLEEPILRKRFGQIYIDYTKQVPRWWPAFP